IAEQLQTRAAEAREFLRTRLTNAMGVCVTSSFQAEDMVVLHLVREFLPEVPVIFLETGYHFLETLAYRDRMSVAWGLNLINVLPEHTVAEQEAEFGILHQTAPDQCCKLRKVGPLFRALGDYRVWVTGLRREQSKSRANLQPEETFALPSGHILEKLNPLAEWTTRDVWHYAEEHNIPLLPLYDLGYSSIGCAPCTSLPSDPNDPRSGRWKGQKLECGIHIQEH
ncbi:MAG TPA: phosphoadenylyl-sulfate reductase, partial [Acidobacteriaceae bacterium]|nr:phosphoadenylyl-sulfate reductase [Acidobacteriaceae bacterium]